MLHLQLGSFLTVRIQSELNINRLVNPKIHYINQMRSQTLLFLLALLLLVCAIPDQDHQATDGQDDSQTGSQQKQPHLFLIFHKPKVQEPTTQPTPNLTPSPEPSAQPTSLPSLFKSKDDSSVPYRYGSWKYNNNREDDGAQTQSSDSEPSQDYEDRNQLSRRGFRHCPWRRRYPTRFTVLTGGIIYVRHIRFIQLIPDNDEQAY